MTTVDINQRLCVIEQPGPSRRGVPTPQVTEAPSRGAESVMQKLGASALDTSAAEGTPNAEQNSNTVMSPVWSRVVKQGRRLNGNATVWTKPCLNPPREKKTSGIVGTSTGGNIQVIKTKLVGVSLLNSHLT